MPETYAVGEPELVEVEEDDRSSVTFVSGRNIFGTIDIETTAAGLDPQTRNELFPGWPLWALLWVLFENGSPTNWVIVAPANPLGPRGPLIPADLQRSKPRGSDAEPSLDPNDPALQLSSIFTSSLYIYVEHLPLPWSEGFERLLGHLFQPGISLSDSANLDAPKLNARNLRLLARRIADNLVATSNATFGFGLFPNINPNGTPPAVTNTLFPNIVGVSNV